MTREVERSLGRIEGTVAEILRRLDEVKTENKALSARLSKLEKAYWKFTGIASAVSVFCTIFGPKILSAMGLG